MFLMNVFENLSKKLLVLAENWNIFIIILNNDKTNVYFIRTNNFDYLLKKF